MTASILTALPSAMALLPRDALGADSETFAIGDRALQAPPMVCLQWGDVSGAHSVVPTPRIRDALFHLFERTRSQIWFHNGCFDIAVILEWYPELRDLVWQALLECRVLDTMFLQRMIQIARGDIGGPLGLDKVCLQYGLPPPTKEIAATCPFTGNTVDVRTSFGLWYGADSIPDPWFSYADYDGQIMLPLAARMVERACVPVNGRPPLVRLEDLGQTVRTYVGHHLWRTYGLKVNPAAVSDLAVAAKSALRRLQDAAQVNGFLKPAIASGRVRPDSTRPEDPKKAATWDKQQGRVRAHAAALAAGHRAPKVCPVALETRPAGPKAPPKKIAAWDKRAAKHRGCPGCKLQRLNADGTPAWSKNTTALKAAVTLAYEGRPPLTEPKKDKKTGKMSGGGQVATSRHVLQDSQNHELEAWGQYNEYVSLMSKDMLIFARGVVHTRIGVTNNLRQSSSDPNCLNFRRTSFYFAACPTCDYELSVDPDTAAKVAKKTVVLTCPNCESDHK